MGLFNNKPPAPKPARKAATRKPAKSDGVTTHKARPGEAERSSAYGAARQKAERFERDMQKKQAAGTLSGLDLAAAMATRNQLYRDARNAGR